MRESNTPSAATRPAFLAAFMPLDLRRSSIAFSISPSASRSAFLHSNIPKPVRSRSSLTIAADTAAIMFSLNEMSFKQYQFLITKKGAYTPFKTLQEAYASLSSEAASSTSTNSLATLVPFASALPSRIASAADLAYKRIARIASSLPGIT